MLFNYGTNHIICFGIVIMFKHLFDDEHSKNRGDNILNRNTPIYLAGKLIDNICNAYILNVIKIFNFMYNLNGFP